MKINLPLLALAAFAVATASPTAACPRLPHGWSAFPKADRVYITGIEYLEPDRTKLIIDPGTTTITPDNVMQIRGRKTRGWLELSMPELGIGNLKLPVVYEGNSDWNLADMTANMWGVATLHLDEAPIANCIFFAERENLSDVNGTRYRATFEFIGRFFDGPLEGALVFLHDTIETNAMNPPPSYTGQVDGVLLVPKSVDLQPLGRCGRWP